MAKQHSGMTVINEVHKEVVHMRTASAPSKCSAANAICIHILIRPNSLQKYLYSAEKSKTTIRYIPNNNNNKHICKVPLGRN